MRSSKGDKRHGRNSRKRKGNAEKRRRLLEWAYKKRYRALRQMIRQELADEFKGESKTRYTLWGR